MPTDQVTHDWIRSKVHTQDIIEFSLLVATIAILVLLCSIAFGGVIHDWFQQLIKHVVGL